MPETLEELIAEINEDGWLLHSLSQYTSPGNIMWSATVRRKGGGRQPIGQGTSYDASSAVAQAWLARGMSVIEPEITVTMEKKQKVSLASVRAALMNSSVDDGPPLRRI